MHRTRDLLVKQRTQLINLIRGLLAAFGIDLPNGFVRALLMASQIVEGKAHDVRIEGAKIVGTLSQNALDTQLSRRGRGALLSSTQLVDGPGIRSHTLWLSECEKAAYLDFLSKSRRPPVTLDETGTLYTDGPAQSPGPSLPETLNPSRRLDRDGEQVITKVVAGTHVEHGFNYDTLIAQVRISKCCDYVSFQRHAIFAGMTSSQPVGARRLSQWRVLAAHKACTDDRAGTCLLPTIYRHRINLTPGWSPSINSTPAASSARRTAAKLLIEGTRRPFSKSRMVLSLRFDRAANSA